ncbi:MAG: sulfotransferase [Candidatus Limnocylindrales bacterium]
MTPAPAAGPDGRGFLTEAGEPRAFVVVSSARSGSNLLVSYLRQVRQVACFGEIFRGEFPGKPGWAKLASRLELSASARALHRSDLTAFWELVLSQGLRRRRWVGAKAFYYHREADAVWSRFEAPDHLVLHLWRDSTFDQYVSRLLAVESGEWKAGDGAAEPRVTFDRDDYLRYRDGIRAGLERTRARYGGRERFADIEYGQLSDHAFVEELLLRLFGERIAVEETLRRQRGRPKLDYLLNPEAAAPFEGDTISRGFADA